MKINVNHREKIKKELEAVENGCSARLFDLDRIAPAIENAEKVLNNLTIPKKYWDGCTIHFDPPKVANSYRGIPEGTFISVTKFPSEWFVTIVCRKHAGNCAFGDNGRETLILTDDAKKSISDVHYL